MYLIRSDNLFSASGSALEEHQSAFAEEYLADETRSREYDSWKYQDEEGAPQGGLVPRGMLWGGTANAHLPARVKFATVFSTKDRLYYVLEMSRSRGVFYYDFKTGHETRLFHRSEFNPRGFFVCEDGSILTTVDDADSTAHLVRFDAQGKHEQILTTGDSLDENPYQRGSKVYFQSSGIARTAEGAVAAVGPAAILRLDESGDIDVVLESQKCDFLLPRVAPDYTLYCIKTPYQARSAYPLRHRLLDIVLFPWRLCVATFHFLNAFSMLFAKRPLTYTGGIDVKPADVSKRMLHNRVVNAAETWRKEGRKVAVSRDWKLIRFADGQLTEIASNVLWFDIDESNGLVYTDGYSVFDSRGHKLLESDELISCLSADH